MLRHAHALSKRWKRLADNTHFAAIQTLRRDREVALCGADIRVGKGRVKSFHLKPRANTRDMIEVARLNNAMDDHLRDVIATEGTVVFDAANARAFFGEDGRKSREATGTIADVRSETR